MVWWLDSVLIRPTTSAGTTYNTPNRSKTTACDGRHHEVCGVCAALFAQWSDAGMTHATVRSIGHEEFVATVPEIQGALGYGSAADGTTLHT